MVCSRLLFEEPAAIYVPLKFAEMVKEVKLAQAKEVSGSFEEKIIGDRCTLLGTNVFHSRYSAFEILSS